MLQVVSLSWVVAVIGEEGGDSHSLRCLVVCCELCKRYVLCPIILKVINVGSQVLLHHGIEFLCLPICLWVECCREPQICAPCLTNCFPKSRRKRRAPIHDYRSRQPSVIGYMLDIYLGQFLGCSGVPAWYQVSHVGELADNDQYCILPYRP